MGKLKIVHFQPEETLLFRDSRKFGPSDNARTIFPSIIPFYGALRTAFLVKKGIDLRDGDRIKSFENEIGNSENPGKLRLWGPFLFEKDENGKIEYFFSPPSNICGWEDQSKKVKTRILKPDPLLKYRYNGDTDLETLWDGSIIQSERVDGKLISLKELENYKLGRSFSLSEKKEGLYKLEFRTGIGMERGSKKAEDKKIFRISSCRFTENCGFAVGLDEGDEIVSGTDFAFLGGKKNGCRVWVDEVTTCLSDKIENDSKCLVLVMPSIFKNGFLPEKGNSFYGTQVKAVSCGKPVPISGWDLINRSPKAMMHAAPSGSVYYVKGRPAKKNLTDFYEPFNFGRYFEAAYEEGNK